MYPQHEMAQGRGNAMATVFALVVLAVLQVGAAVNHLVGGSLQQWNLPPIADPKFYDNWKMNQAFAPGDNLIFEYNNSIHDVQVVSMNEYMMCSTSNGKIYTSGFDIIALPTAGDYLFFCSVVGHCGQGMKLYVQVPGAASPVPMAAPQVPMAAPPVPVAIPPSPVAIPPVVMSEVSQPAVASKLQVGLIAGVCAGGFGAALILGLLLFCFCKRRNNLKSPESKPVQPSDSGFASDANFRTYTFKELSSMTGNFNDSELLSCGAFGDVYRGTPPSGGALVAVKRIKHENENGQASFMAEINSLRQIRHRNLLQLRGWCEAKEGLFLVYDFMSNGSLDMWLHPKPVPIQGTVCESLSWNVRFSILSGVASGLEYLHEGWTQCVLHRDIKSGNVMLDANFNAYLGDFGLARLIDHQKLQKTTMPAGTLGYMAPEMHYTGKATKETDVYAFGMLVLEVVCGRRPFMDIQPGDEPGDFLLLERVWRAHEAGAISKMVDPRNLISDKSWSKSNAEDFRKRDALIASILQWGLTCCLPSPSDRPSMRLVNNWFQSCEAGDMVPPSLPATKPAAPGPPPRYISRPQFSDGSSSSIDINTQSSLPTVR